MCYVASGKLDGGIVLEGNKEEVKFPDNYVIGGISLYFCYDVESEEGVSQEEIEEPESDDIDFDKPQGNSEDEDADL